MPKKSQSRSTSFGGFGPSACAFFKKIFKAAQTNGRWVMASGQPEVLTTWNTFMRPPKTYWNMRFSVAGAAMDAQVQNGIMPRDRTRNLAVVGRQPRPNPNYAPYSPGGRPHCAAAVDPPGEV